MHIAAFKGYIEVLRALIEFKRGCRWFSLDAERSFADQGNQAACIDFLLDLQDEGVTYDLIKALKNARSVSTFKRLYLTCLDWICQAFRANRFAVGGNFMSECFCRAALEGRLELMQHLVRHGSRSTIGRHDDDRAFPSAMVRPHRRVEVLEFLLENRSTVGYTALQYACRHGNPDAVRLLLSYGARDVPGKALRKAVLRENEEAVRLLLEAGVGVGDEARRIALQIAREPGLDSMVKILEVYESYSRTAFAPTHSSQSNRTAPPLKSPRSPSSATSTSSEWPSSSSLRGTKLFLCPSFVSRWRKGKL